MPKGFTLHNIAPLPQQQSRYLFTRFHILSDKSFNLSLEIFIPFILLMKNMCQSFVCFRLASFYPVINNRSCIKVDIFLSVVSGWKHKQLKYMSCIIIAFLFAVGHLGPLNFHIDNIIILSLFFNIFRLGQTFNNTMLPSMFIPKVTCIEPVIYFASFV